MAEEETQTAEAEAEEATPAEKAKPKATRGGKTSVANKIDQVFDLIKEMTVLELRDLNKRIEEEFGVTAAAPVAIAAAPPAAGGAGPGRVRARGGEGGRGEGRGRDGQEEAGGSRRHRRSQVSPS